MNAMGSDYIREVNVVKSARVGYSKMLLGVYAYFIEHKQRNTLIWLPTDGDAENFMKTHVEADHPRYSVAAGAGPVVWQKAPG